MDKLLTALRQYEREQREKRAVLLLPDGGYYLFDRQFCSIQEYELSLTGPDIYVQGNRVPCGLFWGMVEDKLHWSVRTEGNFKPEQLILIFHIALENEEDLLRGILFIRQQNTCFSLFTDPDIEKLYRTVSQPVQAELSACADETLTDYARSCIRNDLHRLTALYLHGTRLSQLWEVTGT